MWKSRFLRGALFVFVGGTIIAIATGSWVRSKLISEQCIDIDEANLTLKQFADLKGRLDAYQGEETPEAFMELSEEELSFVVSSHMNIKARLFFHDEHGIRALATVPASSGCYNIAFRGEMEVNQGIAKLTPQELMVGSVDLTSWLNGRGIEVRPDQLSGRASKMLANTRQLEVHDNWAKIQLDDREAVW
jgi:hypothetical protein